jgi:hypothetical protein
VSYNSRIVTMLERERTVAHFDLPDAKAAFERKAREKRLAVAVWRITATHTERQAHERALPRRKCKKLASGAFGGLPASARCALH